MVDSSFLYMLENLYIGTIFIVILESYGENNWRPLVNYSWSRNMILIIFFIWVIKLWRKYTAAFRTGVISESRDVRQPYCP